MALPECFIPAVMVLWGIVAINLAVFLEKTWAAKCACLMGGNLWSSNCPSVSKATVLVGDVCFSGGFLLPFAEYLSWIILAVDKLLVGCMADRAWREDRNLCLHANEVFFEMPTYSAAFLTDMPLRRA